MFQWDQILKPSQAVSSGKNIMKKKQIKKLKKRIKSLEAVVVSLCAKSQPIDWNGNAPSVFDGTAPAYPYGTFVTTCLNTN